MSQAPIRRKATVFSGGGSTGSAWMLGLASALRDGGIDLGDADVIVGTSAGARVAAQLATGAVDKAVAITRRGEYPIVQTYAALDQFVAASMRVLAEVADETDAAQ